MQASRAAKTSDHLGRYYTDTSIATLLVEAVAGHVPALVLDLGAGAGALVLEGAAAWPAARFVTVDFDAQAPSARLPAERGPAFTHHEADALADDLPARIGLLPGSVDVALCNPPYLRPCWLPHYATLLADAGLAELGPKLREVPADLLFLAQNLRFLKDGGRLGLIIPDGIIAGERFAAVRAALLQHHRIARVIELPRRVFKNTDAKAHILVLEKNAFDGKSFPVQRVEPDGTLAPAILLTADQATQRMDYSFYVNAHSESAGEVLRALGAVVWRGRISSTERKALDFPVFHTSDFDATSAKLPAHFSLTTEQAARARGTVADAGDILLARIGRTLEQKVCCVTVGPVAVSDSVLVLRVPALHQAAVYAFLTSTQGRAALGALAHGVAARFITARALMDDLRVPLA
jgi:type I restriction enzyme M protein